MPSFQDSAVLVLLALLLFGPKKLPVLARQLGKLMADFRRASNEFRSQMEEELRISEQAERQKQIAALEASAPSALPSTTDTIPEPEHPHLPSTHEQEPLIDSPTEAPIEAHAEPLTIPEDIAVPEPIAAPLPIATAGDLSIMPPATGLPIANGASPHAEHVPELETETLHG